jgi:hypothetical protein
MMKKILAAMALVTTSFTPLAIAPAFADHTSADVALCTDTSYLGNSSNGHYFVASIETSGTAGVVDGDQYWAGKSGNAFVLRTTTAPSVVQRCSVLNKPGNDTGTFYDIPLHVGGITTEEIKVCQNVSRTESEPTGAVVDTSVDCTRPA